MSPKILLDLSLEDFSGSLIIHRPNEENQKIEFGAEPDSRRSYLIASISKVLTGFLFWSLEQQGKIELSQSIADIIKVPKRFEKISVLDLLTHHSGLTDNVERSEFIDINIVSAPETTFQRYFELHGDLASGFNYSNTAYSLLAYLGEVVTKCAHEDYLKNLFQSLKLTKTKLITENDVDKRIFADFPYDWLGYKGADGVITTSDDLNILCNHIIAEIAPCFNELKIRGKLGLTDIPHTYYSYGWNFETDASGDLKSIWVSGASWPEGFISFYKYRQSDLRSITLLSDSPQASNSIGILLRKIDEQ